MSVEVNGWAVWLASATARSATVPLLAAWLAAPRLEDWLARTRLTMGPVAVSLTVLPMWLCRQVPAPISAVLLAKTGMLEQSVTVIRPAVLTFLAAVMSADWWALI